MMTLKDINMKPKLTLLFILVGLIPLAFVGWWSSSRATDALMDKTYAAMVNIRDSKKAQIQRFLADSKEDITVLAETIETLRREAYKKLDAVQEMKKRQILNYFESMKSQIRVLKDNPFVLNAMIEFDRAYEEAGNTVDTPEWKALARQYDPRMKDIMKDNEWYDLFLIHDDGDIVYTVQKEEDFGKNIERSELQGEGIGKAFEKARKMEKDDVAFVDLSAYSASDGKPAGFMIAQMRDEYDILKGYIAFQIPLKNINEIMQQRDGMGKTGESYLVGADGLMRSDSYLDPENHSVAASFEKNTQVQTQAVRQALAGHEDARVILDYRGVPVLSSWDTVDLGDGVRWAMMSEVDVEEAFSPVDEDDNAFFARYKELYGYYDLYLCLADGWCFYTVEEEDDYRTNMLTGPYSNSHLGQLFRQVAETKAFGFADFEPYAPSNNEPVAFIAQPVLNKNGELQLIVALQLSIGAINTIMQDREGMGKTGETYLVGPDKLMRSDSSLDPEHHSVHASFANPEQGRIDTAAVNNALDGETGEEVVTDYSGSPVLSAYTPVTVWDTTWVLLAKIDEAEVFTPINSLLRAVMIAAAIVAAAVVVTALTVARGIANPLVKGTQLANAVALGDLSGSIDVRQQDEVGILAEAMRTMVANLKNTVKIAERIADGDLTADVTIMSDKDVLGQALAAMVERLQTIVGDVKNAAENVSSGSQEMSSSATEMSQGATEQAASAEEASSSMEEMAANIRQNAENAQQTEKIAAKAAQDAEDSGKAVAQAVNAMREIVKKISIVEEIARQTHMLSLNATIEAARAEEQGKGFGVVASEVRALAERSQKAASEISQLAGQSTAVAERAGEMLQKLVPDIQKTAELVQEISAASSEQNRGSEQINQAIQQLDQVIQQNASVSEEMSATSEELAAQAEHLQATIDFFQTGEAERKPAAFRKKPAEKTRTGIAAQIHSQVAHIRDHRKIHSPETGGNGDEPGGHDFMLGQAGVSEDEKDVEFERF